jgi:hypothetical protein
VSFVLDHKNRIPADQFFEMRYEDLLAGSHEQLRRLMDFLDYPVKDDVLSLACRQIDSGRLHNSTFAANYQDDIRLLVANPLMQKLGYN